MKPHTLYVIEMIFKMIIALIAIAFIIHYLITEYKLNAYREELKKKVDTKTRIKKMNKEYNKNVKDWKIRKSNKILWKNFRC